MMEKNQFKTQHLKLKNPETVGRDIELWFEEQARNGKPVGQVVSVSFFLTQELPKTIAMSTPQQMPVFIFNFVIVYTEKPSEDGKG